MAAAAHAVAKLADPRPKGASLLPPIHDLRSVSLAVAMAVAQAAADEGLARTALTDIERQLSRAMWQPEYARIVPAT